MSKRLIYGLLDPRTNEIRYIGKSTYGLERPKKHQRHSILKRDHKSNWLRQLFDAGLTCEIVVLEELSDAHDINEREISWIAYAKTLGWRLTNLTAGGDGASGLVVTVEHRKKISDATRGKQVSQESRTRISAGLKGRAKSAAHKEALSRAHKGQVISESTRQLLRKTRGIPVVHVATGTVYGSCREAAKSLGLWQTQVSRAVKGLVPDVKGHVFKRASTLFTDGAFLSA
jgi:hypothetical protein